MNIEFTEEQNLLRNTLERFIRENYNITARRKLTASDRGFSESHWQFFAETGLLALPFAEADGGLAGGADDLMLVMEMLGRGLIVEPYFANIVLAGGIIAKLEKSDLRQALLEELISGSLHLGFAHAESGHRFEPGILLTHISKNNAGWQLNGEKYLVLNGNNASRLLITAHSDKDTIICLLDTKLQGITFNSYQLVDDSMATTISFDKVSVDDADILAIGGQAQWILKQVLLESRAAQCAEAYGCMQALLEQTLDYVQIRKQFGRSISSFQTVQHRLANMYTDCEQAKGMMMLANLTRENEEWPGNVAAAKAFICNKARKVGHEAIQLHGGMGVTEELAIGHYHKKIMLLTTLFGNEDAQIAEYIEQQNCSNRSLMGEYN